MQLKIALILDYHDLTRIAKLFQMLDTHFTNGWISFERHGKLQPAIQPILWLKEDLKPEDRTFLNSLKGPLATLPNPEPRHDVIRYWEIVGQTTEAPAHAPANVGGDEKAESP
jgi:hypothetical protein